MSKARPPEGRYRVISAVEAEKRFGLYPEQIYALVEAGLVHDVGTPARDPRKSDRGHTKYPEWELAKAAQDLAGGLTIVELVARSEEPESRLS
ncbi:MAG TPA: hypothetical protein VN906_13400 [Candidatus Sulfotelmatobacter sp.]|nr:hypothetical protein [Candidatus Sulfotelmatobacter sp.]